MLGALVEVLLTSFCASAKAAPPSASRRTFARAAAACAACFSRSTSGGILGVVGTLVVITGLVREPTLAGFAAWACFGDGAPDTFATFFSAILGCGISIGFGSGAAASACVGFGSTAS